MGIFPPCQPTHLLDGLFGSVCGKTREVPKNVRTKEIKASVVLMKKSTMDATDVGSSILDRFHELFGRGVTLQLISSTGTGEEEGKFGKEAHIEDWITKFTSLNADDDATFDVTFQWDESFGFPGGFVIRNHHHSQFYLKTVTLEHVPGYGPVNFVCFSWIYPKHRYQHDRVFFANKAYLPDETPEPLRFYREQELSILQGKGAQPGEFKEWDRVYDYATYNDLCDPHKKDQMRPILGGTSQYPYPRRGKTGRKPNSKDPRYESRLFLLSLNIYVPRDEQFNQVKFSDFIAYALKSVGQMVVPEIRAVFDKTFNEFDTFHDVYELYDGGLKLPEGPAADKLRHCVPWELLRELMRNDGERFLKLPLPDVIKGDRTAWRTDVEFGREMLAGVNPVIIQRLREFPIRSKLPRRMYGNQDSTIMKEHLEKNMNGLTVEQAIEENKLFILDHHDTLITYLRRVNTTTTKTYASRTVLLLQEDETLKPLAIELSLPGELRDDQGATSDVYTPAEDGVEGTIWQLAKAYAAVNDSGVHQLISHWLHTHAVIEPFIIATNRQLSVLHPINKLLKPHFRDTMHINALARQTLINAGGVLERTVFPGKFALEMSTAIYKSWNFAEQGLPDDLIKRGMAVRDESEPHGIRLVIKDYPYAVDGLEIWAAIKTWVTEYCNFYYTSDEKMQGDTELQSWWKEVRMTGHGDLKEKPWWPAMQTREELIQSLTIIIWIASALHAAVNFGQYPYAGFLPNRPTVSRRFMPKPGTPEYNELTENPDGAFLKTITAQFQTILGVSLIEILSRHTADEVYLGQREDKEWADEAFVKEGFDRFGKTLVGIEKKITERNKDKKLKNRVGPVNVPYELLFPNTSDWSREGGLEVKGVPNSISI